MAEEAILNPFEGKKILKVTLYGEEVYYCEHGLIIVTPPAKGQPWWEIRQIPEEGEEAPPARIVSSSVMVVIEYEDILIPVIPNVIDFELPEE